MAYTHRLAGLAVILSLSLLLPAVAQAGEAPRGVWVVSTATAPIGTLTLRDGKLIYRTSPASDSWEIDLSDAKRVELSKTTANAIEVENGWGNTYVLRILNAHLTTESPSKAFKSISVAMKNATGARRTADAATATDSVKVVRVNGGQIR